MSKALIQFVWKALYLSTVFLYYTVSSSCECAFEIIDNTERDNEVKKLKRDYSLYKSKFEFFRVANMGLQFQGKRVKII